MKGVNDIEGNVSNLSGIKVAQRPDKKRTPRDKLVRLECFSIVDSMVRRGIYANRIAKFIQDESGELLELSFDTVSRMVRSYRAMLEQSGIEAAIVHDEQTISDYGDPLHELRVLQDMFNLHNERIQMEVATEKGLRKLFSTTHKEIEILERLGSSILDRKSKLGIIVGDGQQKRAAGALFCGRLDMAEVAQRPESRQKVLSMVEAIFGDEEIMDDLIKHGGISGIKKIIQGKQEEAEGEIIDIEPDKKNKSAKQEKSKKIIKVKDNDNNDKRRTP